MDQDNRDHSQTASTAPKTSRLAIASLVTAVLCAPVGIVLGIVALIQIDKDRQRLTGSGLAVAGIIMGAAFVMISPIMAAILFPVFANARESARTATCINNIKQISVAMSVYAGDYAETYQPASAWNDLLHPYVRNTHIMTCPKDDSGYVSYGMNSQLDRMRKGEIASPADTVMVFDSVPGDNQHGGPELLPDEPRHRRGHVVGFVDGHVRTVQEYEIDGVNWDATTLGLPDGWDDDEQDEQETESYVVPETSRQEHEAVSPFG